MQYVVKSVINFTNSQLCSFNDALKKKNRCFISELSLRFKCSLARDREKITLWIELCFTSGWANLKKEKIHLPLKIHGKYLREKIYVKLVRNIILELDNYSEKRWHFHSSHYTMAFFQRYITNIARLSHWVGDGGMSEVSDIIALCAKAHGKTRNILHLPTIAILRMYRVIWISGIAFDQISAAAAPPSPSSPKTLRSYTLALWNHFHTKCETKINSPARQEITLTLHVQKLFARSCLYGIATIVNYCVSGWTQQRTFKCLITRSICAFQ